MNVRRVAAFLRRRGVLLAEMAQLDAEISVLLLLEAGKAGRAERVEAQADSKPRAKPRLPRSPG